jgi:hypothetical protein
MPVRFSTRCPNSEYLGLEASPEANCNSREKRWRRSGSPKKPTSADFRYPDWVILAPGLSSRRTVMNALSSSQILSDERIQASRSFSSNGLLR